MRVASSIPNVIISPSGWYRKGSNGAIAQGCPNVSRRCNQLAGRLFGLFLGFFDLLRRDIRLSLLGQNMSGWSMICIWELTIS